MRILVISDTHRNHDPLESILLSEGPFDMLIHCGDLEGEEEIIYQLTGPECACVMVPGNNDFFSALPKERSFEIEGFNIWVTHGHHYYVVMDPAIIAEEAESRGVDMVIFGHTHKPLVAQESGVYLVNPGSLTYPRQAGRLPSYIIMELVKDEDPKIEIKYIEDF